MTTNTPSSVSDEERVADALVTVERAEHGLPPVLFAMLTEADQATYRTRARAAIDALKGSKLNLDPSATMTDTRVAEAVERAFRAGYRQGGVVKHYRATEDTAWKEFAIRNEGKSAPPLDQKKGEG